MRGSFFYFYFFGKGGVFLPRSYPTQPHGADRLQATVDKVTGERSRAATALAGLRHPRFADVAVRASTFFNDPRYTRHRSKLPAQVLAAAGLFLPPQAHGSDPRCFRCGIEISFDLLGAGTVPELVHQKAVQANQNFLCSVARARKEKARDNSFEYATPKFRRA